MAKCVPNKISKNVSFPDNSITGNVSFTGNDVSLSVQYNPKKVSGNLCFEAPPTISEGGFDYTLDFNLA